MGRREKQCAVFMLILSFVACSTTGSWEQQVVAGTGNAGFSDGTSAKLNKPIRMAPYGGNSIVFADINNHAIRVVDLEGNVSTIAGGPDKKGYLDGPASTAQFNSPHGVAYDKNKDLIYVAEAGNHSIRVISRDLDGAFSVATISGSDSLVGFLDGPARDAKFISPHAVNMNEEGELFVADIGNRRIRRIMDGQVSTLAGSGEEGESDGQGENASFNYVMDMVYKDDVIYMADAGSHSIRKITTAGQVSTISIKDTLSTPHGIAIDEDQRLYIADMGSHRILMVESDGRVIHMTGTGEAGPQTHQLNKPAAVLVHAGYLWIADLDNHQIKAFEL